MLCATYPNKLEHNEHIHGVNKQLTCRSRQVLSMLHASTHHHADVAHILIQCLAKMLVIIANSHALNGRGSTSYFYRDTNTNSKYQQ